MIAYLIPIGRCATISPSTVRSPSYLCGVPSTVGKTAPASFSSMKACSIASSLGGLIAKANTFFGDPKSRSLVSSNNCKIVDIVDSFGNRDSNLLPQVQLKCSVLVRVPFQGEIWAFLALLLVSTCWRMLAGQVSCIFRGRHDRTDLFFACKSSCLQKRTYISSASLIPQYQTLLSNQTNQPTPVWATCSWSPSFCSSFLWGRNRLHK